MGDRWDESRGASLGKTASAAKSTTRFLNRPNRTDDRHVHAMPGSVLPAAASCWRAAGIAAHRPLAGLSAVKSTHVNERRPMEAPISLDGPSKTARPRIDCIVETSPWRHCAASPGSAWPNLSVRAPAASAPASRVGVNYSWTFVASVPRPQTCALPGLVRMPLDARATISISETQLKQVPNWGGAVLYVLGAAHCQAVKPGSGMMGSGPARRRHALERSVQAWPRAGLERVDCLLLHRGRWRTRRARLAPPDVS